jgi:hypothetical protein
MRSYSNPQGALPSRKDRYAEGQLGARIDVEHARLVIVDDYWTGMSDEAPLVTTHELRRADGGALVGEARQYRRGAFERAQSVSLRPTDATKLLRLVARARCEPGPYAPLVQWTDDFPRIDVTIHLPPEAYPSGIVLLHTSSQGRYHTPWCITVAGESFVSPGDELGRALATLRKAVPPLPPRRNEWEELLLASDALEVGTSPSATMSPSTAIMDVPSIDPPRRESRGTRSPSTALRPPRPRAK